MLQLQQVSKAYGGVQALHPTDLQIPKGQTTVLLGPSGCGKSTVLRIVVRLVPPDSGSVRFDGTEITQNNIREIRHRMGYMIQDGGLFPHLTVRGNVTLLARHLGWDRPQIRQRLDQLLDLTQLPGRLLDHYPAELSGGQRQRVSLMRALLLDPDVLLLDEPMGALDPLIRSDLQQQLRSIFQSLHKTVLMVTHDIAEAGFLGHHIALLRDGRIVQRGTLQQLVYHPADPFVTQFINAQRSPLETLQINGDQ